MYRFQVVQIYSDGSDMVWSPFDRDTAERLADTQTSIMLEMAATGRTWRDGCSIVAVGVREMVA